MTPLPVSFPTVLALPMNLQNSLQRIWKILCKVVFYHRRISLQEIRLLDSQAAPHLLMIQWVYCMSVCLLVYWWGESCQRGGEAGDFPFPSKKGYLSLETVGEELNAMHNSCQLLEIIFF